MENRPTYYVIIPSNVRYDNELKDKTKILFGEIVTLAMKVGYCFANDKYFADLFETSERTIRESIKEWKENGYVSVEYIYRENTKDIKRRLLRPIGMEEIFQRVWKKSSKGYGRNLPRGMEDFFQYNNININNKNINKYNRDILPNTLPDWFNKTLETKSISKEKEEELNAIIEELCK